MAYERLNLKNKMILNEDHLRHFEDGIVSVTETVDQMIEDASKQDNNTYTLRLAKIQYVDFMDDYWGNTIEEKAQNIARFDIHVSGGINENTIPIINRAREINPNLKICYYISVASGRGWFDDGWYTFRRGGIWDEVWAKEQSALKNTEMTRPSNKWEILQEIEMAHHTGGTKTGNKIFIETYSWEDENGITHKEDKYIDEYTGGLSYDGFFWDDVGFDTNISSGKFFDTDNSSKPIETIKRQGFNSRREKYIIINKFAHDRGMFVIPNSINKDDLFDQSVSTENPDGLGSSMDDRDFVFIESCLTMVGDANSVIWRNEIHRAVDYLTNWYGKVKSKVICEDYMYSGMDEDTKNHLLTYMMTVYAVVGVHYFAITDVDVVNPTNNLWIPDILRLKVPYDNEDRLKHLTAPSTNMYKYNYASNIVSVTRDRELTNGKVDDYSIVNGIKIFVNGKRIINAMLDTSQVYTDLNEKIDDLNSYVNSSLSDTKRSASIYNRLMIDDWSVEKLEYTKIISDDLFLKWCTESNTKNQSKGFTTTYDITDRKLSWTKTGSSTDGYQTAYMTGRLTPSNYGHTIEMGFSLKTEGTGVGAWIDVFVNGALWFEAGPNPSNGTSTLYPDTSGMYVQTKSIPDYGEKEYIEFQMLCSWNGNSTSATMEKLYIIDLDEFEEDVVKDSYTNLLPKPSSAGAYVDPYLISLSQIDDRSFSVNMLDSIDAAGGHKTYIEGNGPAWWVNSSDILKQGHTYEIGIEDIDIVDGAVSFNFGVNTDTGIICGDIPLNKKSTSKVVPKETYHKLFTVPEDAALGASLLYLRFFKSITAENAGSFTVTNWYLYDIDEENVTIRGVSPSSVSIRIARVTDDMYANDKLKGNLLSNTLYITNTGKMYITDVNKVPIHITT